jgi:hypothetical protein
MNTLPELVAIVTSAVGTDVWDVVYGGERGPVLVVHVPDVGKWWSHAKPYMDRVFEIDGYTSLGIPERVRTRVGVFSGEFAARFEVLEPPVSFGFGVLWVGLTAADRSAVGAAIRRVTGDRMRASVSGGWYRYRGESKRAIPQEFQTPWAAREVLRRLGVAKELPGVEWPGLLRSFGGRGGRECVNP